MKSEKLLDLKFKSYVERYVYDIYKYQLNQYINNLYTL